MKRHGFGLMRAYLLAICCILWSCEGCVLHVTQGPPKENERTDGVLRDAGPNQDTGTSTLGGPCTDNTDCQGGTNYCIKNDDTKATLPFPFSRGPRGGYCSTACSIAGASCPSGGHCFVPGDTAGGCMQRCTADTDCRQQEGYRCRLLRDKVPNGATNTKVCIPPNDRCDLAHFVSLESGTATIQDTTTTARDEHPTLQCGSTQIAGGGLKRGQLYYWSYFSGKRITFTFTPQGFHAFVYIFPKYGSDCSLTKIQQDCSSTGATGMISKIANPGQTIEFSFQPKSGNTYAFAVDSDSGVGSFTLQMTAK